MSKHYTVDPFEPELSKSNFPHYENYNDINEAYNDFIQRIVGTTEKDSLSKTFMNSLMGKLLGKLKLVTNYSHNFRKSKLAH